MALLEVKNLGISFGGLRAVDNLNMSLEKGSLVGLIRQKTAQERRRRLTF